MKKFWNFTESGDGESVLRLDGYIAQDSWFGDEVTPKMFMSELAQHKGNNITVWINSPGGDVVAASQIYTALKEHSGTVTVKIDGIAASAASVIAMAGDIVMMSPPSLLMIHNPFIQIYGEIKDLQHSIGVLNEVKESILNAYEVKTGMSRTKLAHMMDDETWMNSKKAVELGFADKILYNDKEPDGLTPTDSFLFGRRTVFNRLMAMLPKAEEPPQETPLEEIPPQETPPTEIPPPEEPPETDHRSETERLSQEIDLL